MRSQTEAKAGLDISTASARCLESNDALDASVAALVARGCGDAFDPRAGR
jgi:hypothetical protein